MYSSFYRRTFVIVTIAIMGYLLLRVLDPLGGALGWAAVLAFLLLPLHERLTRKFKGRKALSAGLLTGLTPFFVMAPVALLSIAFAGQVVVLLNYMRGRTLLSYTEVLQRLEGYSVIGSAVHWARENAPVSAEQVQGWLTEGAQSVLKTAATLGGSVALGVFGTLVSFVMMLFLLFFFLQDGRAMLASLTGLIPMEPARRCAAAQISCRRHAGRRIRLDGDGPRPGDFRRRRFRDRGAAVALGFWRTRHHCCLSARRRGGSAGTRGHLPDVRRPLGRGESSWRSGPPPCGWWRTCFAPS